MNYTRLYSTYYSSSEALLELIDFVLERPLLLLRQGFVLRPGLQLLLKVLQLLLLVLRRRVVHSIPGNLVSRGIQQVLLRCVRSPFLFLGGRVLGLALNAQVPLLHDPLLRRHPITELLVVRDNEDTALVLLDREHESTEALPVEIIGRLIKHQDVRVLPHGCGQ